MASMTGGQALMLALALLATVGSIATFALIDDRIAQIVVVALIAMILILGSRVALPPEAHRMRTARYAVWVFGAVLTGVAGLRAYIEPLIIAAASRLDPELGELISEHSFAAPSGLVLLATVVMFIAVLWFLRDPPPLGAPATKDPLIREPSYRERRSAFGDVLRSHLQRVDEDLRWHHRDFVNLKAEVDIRNADRVRKRVADLVEAIKQNRDADIFVVVGVPGAGKSVALRKCCMDLLAFQRSTERIPVYVNLKEWMPKRRWSGDSPPTDQEFSGFVRSNIRNRLPDRMRVFFDQHFDRLVDAGELFFMFDSFDEMPGILDVDETSKLLDAVSAVIVRYLRGQSHGRGVIASRYYRRPRLGQERHVQLDVRPFSEHQIAVAVTKSASRPEHLKQFLFKERPELGALARNPFTLSLILIYWEEHTAPPPNQAALYESYISRSLEDAQENLEGIGLKKQDLLQAMADMSWTMFESDRRGLEMPVRELATALGRNDIDMVVDALVAARLVRKAARTQAVSFVHRRFNEYFLVGRWLSGKVAPPFEAIPTDSRFRDALVLYAEVADDNEAERLAMFCWQEIAALGQKEALDPLASMPSIYALRFLTEAFRTRLQPLRPFREQLGERVRTIMSDTDDILTRKIAVEGAGLLCPNDAENVLVEALSTGNPWIADTAFSACRHLPLLPQTVEDRLFNYLATRPQSWILLPDQDFQFILRFSASFERLRRRFLAIRIDMWISFLTGLFLFTAAEAIATGTGLVLFLLFIFAYFCFVIVRLSVNSKFKESYATKPLLLKLEIARIDVQLHQGFSEAAIRVTRLAPVLTLLFLPYTIGYVMFMFEYDAISASELPLYLLVALIISCLSASITILVTGRFNLGKVTNALRSSLEFIPVILCLGLLVFLLFYLLHEIMGVDIVFLTKILALLILISIGLFLFKSIADQLRSWCRDRVLLASESKVFNPSRETIARTFFQLETADGRLRYVRWVERNATEPAALAKLADVASNPWPEGQRPNVNEDKASVLLAQLDARWLGWEV